MRTKTEILDEKFAYGKREWNELWSIPTAARRNWQILALIEGVALIGSVAGLIYLGSLPKQVPYVLKVDKSSGEVSYLGKPDSLDAVTLNKVRSQALWRFIELWRSVTSDRAAQLREYDLAHAYVSGGSKADSFLVDWYAKEDNDPLQRATHGETVSVEYVTSDQESDKTVGIWWDERVDRPGMAPSITRYRARMTYAMGMPKKENYRHQNGLGVMITEISIEKVNQ